MTRSATWHPTYYRSAGLPLDEPLVRQLRTAGLDRRDAPVFVQSFEAGNLLALRTRLGLRAPTVFLTSATRNPFGDPISYAEYLTPEGLRRLSRYVDGIGPDKNQIIPRRADGSLGEPTSASDTAGVAQLRARPLSQPRLAHVYRGVAHPTRAVLTGGVLTASPARRSGPCTLCDVET